MNGEKSEIKEKKETRLPIGRENVEWIQNSLEAIDKNVRSIKTLVIIMFIVLVVIPFLAVCLISAATG